MAVSHVFSNAVADAVGTMTIWFGATTATVAATDVVLPSHWNSAHNNLVTLSGNTAGVSTLSGTNIVYAGSNNVTVSGVQGANAATVHFSAAAGGGGGSLNVSAGTTSNNLTAVTFADSNGVSFGLNGSVVTATVQTNYLTTAMLSNAVTLSNIRVSGGTTSNLLSAITFADGNGVSFGLNAGTMTASHNALTSQSNQNITAGNGGFAFQTLSFSNVNGISFGTSAGSAITASHNAITTGRASNDGVGLNTAQTNVTWTVNSGGISLNAGGYAGTGFTSTTTAGTAVVGTHNTAGLSMGFPVFVTNALTTARASNDAIGLNTAQTNVTWTVNSSGLSLNAAGYAGTGTTFNGANVSGSMTVNSNGVQLSLSGATAAPSPVNISAGTTSNNLATVVFSNSNGVSFGLNGSTITASVAAGGADGGVFAGVSNLGNTAGSTGTVSTGNFVLVGSDGITLSQSTGAAGSAATITIAGYPAISKWRNFNNAYVVLAGGTAPVGSVVSIFPCDIMANLSATNLRIGVSMALATAANNSSAFFDASVSAVVYTRNGSTLSSINSGSATFFTTWTSNATGSIVAVREITLPMGTGGSNLYPPGEYWIAYHLSTANTATGGANTTALANTVSMLLNGTLAQNVASIARLGVNNNASVGLANGLGCIATAATRATIPFSEITHTGTRGVLANLMCELRNYTI